MNSSKKPINCFSFLVVLLFNITVATSANNDIYSEFLAIPSYSTGGKPLSVSVYDITGDGLNDIIIANYSSKKVTIYTTSVNGNLEFYKEIPVSGHPSGVTVGDFKHDFIMDIATSHFKDNTVSVVLGDGSDNYYENIYEAGKKPVAIVAEDTDGNADLVTANLGSTDISVLLGNGDGSFKSPVLYDIGTTVHAVTPGDVNSDGAKDIVGSIFYGDAVFTIF